MFFGSVIRDAHPVPRYLRSSRTGPIRIADYYPDRWQRGLREFHRLLICLLKVCAVFCVAGALGLLFCQCHYDSRAAREDFTSIGNLPERIELFDTQGHFLGSVPWGTTRHSVISVSELPQSLVEALITMEDRNFFEHGGVNWHGVARAIMHDAKSFSLQHGGSSITQQLAKMWKFGIPRGENAWVKLDRKFLEWQLAKRIESKFSKNEILVNYLNRIDFGGGFQGIYAASEGFFAKIPKELSVEESATLVAILRGPGVYSPIVHPENCRARRNLVLREMAKAGKIPESEFRRMSALPLVTKQEQWAAALHGNKEIRLVTKELKASGIPAEVLKNGGLKITLTIDRQWNDRSAVLTQAHLRRIDPRIPNRTLQAAVLVIETRTGAIKALQGGRGIDGDELDRVFQSRRQVGSMAKPFVYELAFAAGISPDRLMRNDEIAPNELWPGMKWSPRNAGNCGDIIPCRDGLIFSQNRLTVRVGSYVGLPVIGDLFERLGVCDKSRIVENPSSIIGSFESRLADMTRAFTIFPLEGYECQPPHIIESVQSKSGAVLFRSAVGCKPVADPAACRITAECLRSVFTRGTAKSAVKEVSPKAIGKTGSTNEAKDCWFVGADEEFTCGVWIGCDTPTRLEGGSGAKLALPLWMQIMQHRTYK